MPALTQTIEIVNENNEVVGHVTPFQMLQFRSALKIQAKTGMTLSRGSVINHCRELGLTTKRTAKGAFADINKICVDVFDMDSVSL